MAHPKNSSNTTCNRTLQTWNLISPRRRKRHHHHLNNMNLMLLIFVGCCSTLILWPLDVHAKDLHTAVELTKGENMLGNDHEEKQQQQGNHAIPEGEGNVVNADKTNDNGIFKRLQPSENAEEEGEDEEEHSSEIIEMIQPPHTLRHQEHFKQRILRAEKDLQHKHEREHQQQSEDYNYDDDEDDKHEEEELSQHNRHLRYQQIQLALREPITPPTPTPIPLPAKPQQQQHHLRRHQQHHLGKQRLPKQTEFKWPQHYLRHQHHQHHQNQQNLESYHNLPQLRHQRHEMRKQQNLTITTTAKPVHQRYFDRESLYLNPLARIATTEGPHLRHRGSNKHWKSMVTNNPHNRLFNDDDDDDGGDGGNAGKVADNNSNDGENHEKDIKRFSLLSSLDTKENYLNDNQDNPTKENISLDEETENGNDDSDDDYSYEDDDSNDKNVLDKQNNKYPSIPNYPKTNVKRYTNPMRSLYKPPNIKNGINGASGGGHQVRHSLYHMEELTSNTNDGDDDDDYDENDEDKSSSSSGESTNVDDDKFSDEKWNKIEHEHYRKQLQHQRAMQALRSRRPVMDNSANINKYSLPSSPPAQSSLSSSLSSSYNTASTKRQITNDDDTDNIYSRYYVPGSVTRKKEEELGSPTAILESRRQYALQQRQNKALASAHHRRIVTEGSCRLPQPRVERIRRDSWKIYTPHCTILHRCADDTGCCPSERQTCAPKRTKNVDLYFFVISLNETQGSIEKLTFVNHTECHCVDKSKQRAPEYGASGAREPISNQITYLRRATILNCNCPNLYEKILQEDGYCRCDCSSGNMGCDWLKRGMEHFSMNDRKCILEGRCKLPTCEYGQYIKKHGRCPRREERQLSADVDW